MQRYYNGYNYNIFLDKIYFSLIKVLKSKKKKLALTFPECLGQEFDDSWKVTYTYQSRFYNLFHLGKFKNA